MSNHRHVIGLAVAALSVAALTPLTAAADAPPAIHRGQTVPITPKMGGAQVTDGRIMTAERVGTRIIIGGTFTTFKLPDGSTANQPYLAALNVDTGALDLGFRPAVNGEVNALEAGDTPDTVFVGGRFSSLAGAAASKLGKLNTTNGALLPWKVSASAAVTALDRLGDRLFVGGDFGSVNGQARSRLAEVSASTGKLNPNFTVGVTGNRNAGVRPDGAFRDYPGPAIRSLRVAPAGRRLLVVHRGDLVGGQQRWGAAFIDITKTTPVVTPWRTRLWEPVGNQPLDGITIQAADMSPDGKMFVVVSNGGNFPPLHDTAVAFPTTGTDNVQPLWVTQTFDSPYSVAVSDAAVYIGGHFCWTESQQSQVSPMYWPGESSNDYSCQKISGSVFQPQTTARYHLAALNLTAGHALETWQAKSNNSWNGVHLLKVIDRGLLVGHDGTMMGNRTVGRFGFFDLGSSFNA